MNTLLKNKNETNFVPVSRIFVALGLAVLLLFWPCHAGATTVTVMVGNGGFRFSPSSVAIHVGDTVQWMWSASGHSSTSGTPGSPNGLWDSGVLNQGSTFSHTFTAAGTFAYYCTPHGACCGMTGSVSVSSATPTPTPTPTPSSPPSRQLLNIATRLNVLTGNNVLIGGFIVTGSDPKQVLIEAIGPSLTKYGVMGALADPVLELHKPDGSVVTNDNWKTTQEAAIAATGLAPSDDNESAILATLAPGAYTAIVRGNNGTGVAIVQAYDRTPTAGELGNIATRGFVDTGENVMIGGFIIGGGTVGTNATVLIRGIGPSLAKAGITGALQDPTLELHDGNGNVLKSNDNWQTTQADAIKATGLAPSDPRESAILDTLAPGSYTAILRGKNNTTGVALVEVYAITPTSMATGRMEANDLGMNGMRIYGTGMGSMGMMPPPH